MKTIDDYINERNAIQLKAEAIADSCGARCWAIMGVANRHIARVVEGILPLLPMVEKEIQQSLTLGRQWLETSRENSTRLLEEQEKS